MNNYSLKNKKIYEQLPSSFNNILAVKEIIILTIKTITLTMRHLMTLRKL